MNKTLLGILIASWLALSASVNADTFGTGSNQFTIDFTTIGNPGNDADTTGYGSVGYTYRMGTYAISQNQIDAATASGLGNVTAGAWSGDQPAANMSWYESAAFVNWLNTSKGFAPAYNLSWTGSTWSMALWSVTDPGYNADNLFRNSLAHYFLPSENEFYKAAYGRNDGSGYYLYPTASDAAPTPVTGGTAPNTAVYDQSLGQGPASVTQAGGLSSYGTMGQGGNVWEWEEGAANGINTNPTELRGIRGGHWFVVSYLISSQYRESSTPGVELNSRGFRVASVADVVPEPSTYALFGIGAVGLLIAMRRKKTT